MKTYFGYVRVSTVKQGEKGSSLQEQKSAIENYAGKNNLRITQWYEELETAAKQGRPVFTRMLRALQQQRASGVIIHKIDRSARNLRDWAMLGELHDRGIELHFAYESIDLGSRGGRLSADIQAVVAADYIRNLRDEVKKGFYGRLKQGYYPLAAPIGYEDNGGGKVKTIDPVRGPLVAKAFELYATGEWSLHALQRELEVRGLRARKGSRVTKNGLSTLFNNIFYVGLIHISKTGETFQGLHQPLVPKPLFDKVQSVLKGKTPYKVVSRHFKYQRLLRCAACSMTLSSSLKNGTVYYRCHTRTCPTTCVREDSVDLALNAETDAFQLEGEEWEAIERDANAALLNIRDLASRARKGVDLNIAAVDERLARLTDAYLDHILDVKSFNARKDQLLRQKADLEAQKDKDTDTAGQTILGILEMVKALGRLSMLPDASYLRELLKMATSKISVDRKNIVFAWENPFQVLVNMQAVTSGGPKRAIVRKNRAATLSKEIVTLAQTNFHPLPEKEALWAAHLPPKPAGNARNIIEFNEKRRAIRDRKMHPPEDMAA